jgi:glycosyltransferase involved in cell wall biosynthesis
MQERTIGLSMIVKNESHVILRLLNSIYKHIDYWAIVDTGSTDGTQEIIRNFFTEKNLPGELIEMEWVDFSTCRNVALEAIEKKTDYGIWIDADEEFIPMQGFDIKIALSKDLDVISVPTRYGGVDYTRKSIWKCGRGFKWRGPIHELLESPDEKTGGVLHGAHVLVRAEGHSWQNIREKYLSHAGILEKYTEVNDEPRWIFYTAQSYRDAGELEKSFDWYRKRAEILEGGFAEEVYFSRFMMAKMAEMMNKDKREIIELYNIAHKTDPVRGESIKSLVQFLQKNEEWEQAYIYSQYGLRYNQKNPYPHRILFVDNALYEFQMMELHSISCFYTKRLEEGSRAYWQARSQIKPGSLTEAQVQIMKNNEKHFMPLEALSKTGPQIKMPSRAPVQAPRSGSNFTPPKKKRKK